MPLGRPTDYKPEYCQRIVEFMKDGASLTEFAASIMTYRQRIHEWAKKHSEFQDALRLAQELCEAWWAKQGREHLLKDDQGRDTINTGLYKWNTAARFKWSEKQEIEQNTTQTIKLAYSVDDKESNE